MGTLVLTHDLDAAKRWILQQDLGNPFILDERDLALQNSSKFSHGFLDLNYSDAMVETMRISILGYKYQRPLVILMDMRHQTAIEKLPHDASILLYDGSKSRRIAYNLTYKTQHLAQDLSPVELQKMLQNVG